MNSIGYTIIPEPTIDEQTEKIVLIDEFLYFKDSLKETIDFFLST
jgi:hypothetical protein